jgi:tetratricopeptide (TPR) repeat protein
VTKSYTANPEAYRLYLQGRYFWNKRTTENLKKAIQEFQQAAEADPNYALAYVGLADSYVLLEDYAGTPSSETLPQARNYATRALAIDNTLGEAHASMGYINDRLWQWAEAEREYKRALELNPNYATAHQWYYSHLLIVGRQEEATEEIKRAQELDPLSVVININVAVFYLIRGDVSAAVEESKKTIELDPNFSPAYSFLGLTYLKQGRNDLALAEMQKAVELSHRSTGSIAGLAYTYAVTEKRNEALAIVKELEEKYAKGEAQGWMIAGVYVGLGQKDEAFAWLEKDFQARNSSLSVISFSPSFDPLRSEPRYADLLRRMNLPQ